MIIQDEELRNLYAATGTDRLQKLQTGLLQLEQEPGDQTILEELRREIHSLKGDSRSVGLDTIATLAQQIEDIIKAVQHQDLQFTLELSDHLYQGIHATGQLVHEAVTGEVSDVDFEQMLDLLRVIPISVTPSVSAAPAAEPTPAPTATILYIEDDELREVYRTTSEGRLRTLNTYLNQLEQGPVDTATLEVLRREAHSLKGDSKAVGLDTIAGLTQPVEEIIKNIQRQSVPFTTQVSDCLYSGLEAISQLVQESVSGEPSGINIDQLQDYLVEVAAAVVNSPPEAFPAVERMVQPISNTIEDAELLEIYRTTSEERLQQLETNLLHLEKNPHDYATLATLMREAHSLKGDSRSAGLDSVEAVAHAIEDVLNSIQCQVLDLDSMVSDRLYQGLDAIGQLVREAVTGVRGNVDTGHILQVLRETIPLTIAASDEPRSSALSIETILPEVPTLTNREESISQIETVRIQTRELDALMVQAEELAVTRIQIAQTYTQTQQLMALWEEWQAHKHQPQSLNPSVPPYEERLENLLLHLRSIVQENSSKLELVAEELRDRIRRLQLLPVSTLFQPLPRVVRDLAKQQSKDINLVLEGEDTTADKRLLEGIKDALMHLVRNAIDHGIETADERKASSKPATATLRVKAYQTAISLMIEITDDGRGLDIEQIKRTAVKRRLYSPSDLAAMSDNQIQRLILAPGFSTRSFITEISGRGVGLDVVRTQVERLKGSIQIESTLGQGCTFRLQLSKALSTANVVLLETQGITLALPIEFLQTTVLVAPEQIVMTEGQATIVLDDQEIPVANLVDVLELPNSPVYSWVAQARQSENDHRPCILLKVGTDQAGFFVDRLINQQEVVSKPLSHLLKRVRNVTGATILATGEVCMILNPPDLLKSLQQHLSDTLAIAKRTTRHQPVILLVEDSPPVRIQEKRLFEGAGYRVITATNGLEGYNRLKTHEFDAIVSDVEMPHLDGFSLVAKIRQHPEYDDLPIVLVTTLDSDADRKRGADAGANAYIIKGRFNQEALLDTLERLI
ncbi:MAG: response regulator [Cyanothece sp. SIO1E1]|nr:response regulator [Cyanothece sp. SIO1E1]